MTSWICEFFSNGHSLEYIYNMSYWDFMEIQSHLGESRRVQSVRASGQKVFKQLSPSQKLMVERRKEQRAKEGIKVAR